MDNLENLIFKKQFDNIYKLSNVKYPREHIYSIIMIYQLHNDMDDKSYDILCYIIKKFTDYNSDFAEQNYIPIAFNNYEKINNTNRLSKLIIKYLCKDFDMKC